MRRARAMNPGPGSQGKLVDVSFVDAGCIRCRADELEDDVVRLADAIASGRHATEPARVLPGAAQRGDRGWQGERRGGRRSRRRC